MPDRSPCRPLASIQNKVSPKDLPAPPGYIRMCAMRLPEEWREQLARGVTDARPATTRVHHASRRRGRAEADGYETEADELKRSIKF